jgi:uncharacterized protein YegP (UPF0339 family)
MMPAQPTPTLEVKRNSRGPQRYKYVLRSRTGHIIMQSRMFRSRTGAVNAALLFLRVIQQGVDFHE